MRGIRSIGTELPEYMSIMKYRSIGSKGNRYATSWRKGMLPIGTPHVGFCKIWYNWSKHCWTTRILFNLVFLNLNVYLCLFIAYLYKLFFDTQPSVFLNFYVSKNSLYKYAFSCVI